MSASPLKDKIDLNNQAQDPNSQTDRQVGDRLYAESKRKKQIQDELRKKYEDQKLKECTFLPKTNRTAKRQRASTQAPQTPEKIPEGQNLANNRNEVHNEDETPYEKSDGAETPQRGNPLHIVSDNQLEFR